MDKKHLVDAQIPSSIFKNKYLLQRMKQVEEMREVTEEEFQLTSITTWI